MSTKVLKSKDGYLKNLPKLLLELIEDIEDFKYDHPDLLERSLFKEHSVIRFNTHRRAGHTTASVKAAIKLAKRGDKVLIVVPTMSSSDGVKCIIEEFGGDDTKNIKVVSCYNIHNSANNSISGKSYDYVFITDFYPYKDTGKDITEDVMIKAVSPCLSGRGGLPGTLIFC